MTSSFRLAAINEIGSRLAARCLERLGDDKGNPLGKQQSQDTTIHLPETILPAPGPAQLALAGDRVLRLAVGEDAIDEEGVDDDQDEGECAGDAEGVGDWDALVDGVGVLQGIILQGKVLVVRFEGVEDGEADHAGTRRVSGSMGGGVEEVLYIRMT